MDIDEQRVSWFYLLDGDRVGDLLNAAAAAGDIETMSRLSFQIDADRTKVGDWYKSQGCRVWISSSDTLLVECPTPVSLDALPDCATVSWSVGQGPSLSHAHAALAAAKARGRGCAVTVTDFAEKPLVTATPEKPEAEGRSVALRHGNQY